MSYKGLGKFWGEKWGKQRATIEEYILESLYLLDNITTFTHILSIIIPLSFQVYSFIPFYSLINNHSLVENCDFSTIFKGFFAKIFPAITPTHAYKRITHLAHLITTHY